MSDGKTPMTLADLQGWAGVARRNGTQDAFIGLALQWAEAAHAEVARRGRIGDEWAAVATKGLQFLRDVDDGITSASMARGDMEALVKHYQEKAT